MKLYHFTKSVHMKKIRSSGQIKLEACNEKLTEDDKHLFKTIGRYVWLTQDSIARSAGRHVDTRFEFDSDEIHAMKWTDVCKRFTTPEQIAVATALNSACESYGDSIDDYWVCAHPINIKRAKSITTV